MTETTAETIEQKLAHLVKNLRELEELRALPRARYDADKYIRAAAERFLQTSIEVAIDCARLVIIEEQLRRPSEVEHEFAILAEGKLLPLDLADRLGLAKRFRNLLVHEYARVDSARVYQHLSEDLGDLHAFVKHMARYLEQQEKS